MNKKILALVLAFVMLLGIFAGCKKEENNKGGLYYEDSEGNTHYVQVDENGKYFVTDKDGNASYIEDESIINQLEEHSISSMRESIAEEIEENPDKFFEEAGENNFEMSDELVTEEIESVPGETGSANAVKRYNKFNAVIQTNKFTISAIIKETGTKSAEYPFFYVRSGDNAYVETAAPFDESGRVIKANMIILDGVTYCEMPSMKSYMIVDDMGIEDLADGIFSNNALEGYEFVESGTVTLNGQKYTCDVFSSKYETVKYYYDSNDTLIRIESIGKRNSTITEIKSIKNTADESKIRKPKGINLTNMVG